MPHLTLIRRVSVSDRWDYYDRKTEVWVFGDVAGYDELRGIILDGMNATRNIHVSLLLRDPNSMAAVILPAQASCRDKPRVKCIERLVWLENRPRMELVIAGNQGGYRILAERLALLSSSEKTDVAEHLHADDDVDSWLVPRSVALNFRAPLTEWNGGDLGEFADMVERPGEDFLPKELAYRLAEKEEYAEISVEESEAVRI